MEGMADSYDLDDDFYANTFTEGDRAAFEAEPESPRRFLVAWALALFLGPVGAQRYYLGLIPTALTKSFLFGCAAVFVVLDNVNVSLLFMGVVTAWTIIDLFLLLSGSMRDRDELRLAGFRKYAGPCAAITVLVLVGFLITALVMGTSAGVTDPG